MRFVESNCDALLLWCAGASGGFFSSVSVLRAAPELMTQRQRGLNWLLTAGTVFARGNSVDEVYRFIQPQPSSSAFSCRREAALVHPLMTPCFFGALIYLAALVVSIFTLHARHRTSHA